MNEYSDEQKKDITERVKKANDYMSELKLKPSVVPSWELKDGVYGLKLLHYLQDVKYTSIPSPIQP